MVHGNTPLCHTAVILFVSRLSPRKQLATELALRPLINDQLVALLSNRAAAGGDLDDVALGRYIDIAPTHARYIKRDHELVAATHRLHGKGARGACAGQGRVGQPVEFAKRIESH